MKLSGKKSVKLTHQVMLDGIGALRRSGFRDADLVRLLGVVIQDLHPEDLAGGIRCIGGVDLPGEQLVELDRMLWDSPEDEDEDEDADEDEDEDELDRLFAATWAYLASRGQCDDIGSAQYRRIREQWQRMGRSDDVRAWLRGRLMIDDRAPHPAVQMPSAGDGDGRRHGQDSVEE